VFVIYLLVLVIYLRPLHGSNARQAEQALNLTRASPTTMMQAAGGGQSEISWAIGKLTLSNYFGTKQSCLKLQNL